MVNNKTRKEKQDEEQRLQHQRDVGVNIEQPGSKIDLTHPPTQNPRRELDEADLKQSKKDMILEQQMHAKDAEVAKHGLSAAKPGKKAKSPKELGANDADKDLTP